MAELYQFQSTIRYICIYHKLNSYDFRSNPESSPSVFQRKHHRFPSLSAHSVDWSAGPYLPIYLTERSDDVPIHTQRPVSRLQTSMKALSPFPIPLAWEGRQRATLVWDTARSSRKITTTERGSSFPTCLGWPVS